MTHIGGFAAHIGAGEQHQAVFVVERGVVGGEVAHLLLDHGVAAALDFNHGIVGKFGGSVAALLGMAGEGGEHIKRGGGFGGLLQLRQDGLQVFQYFIKQLFFERQRGVLRGQHFFFKGFQLGRDEALGVFEGLAAGIIFGRLLGLHFG